MKMIRQLMGCIREYKKPTILTLVCMVGEVAIEVLIPFITAKLINEVKAGAELGGIVRAGLVLMLMAPVALLRRSGRFLRLARERGLCKKRPARRFYPRAVLFL